MKLILSILLPQMAGAIGSFFTIQAIPTWYALLNKPSFSPPNWIFAPVWLALYLMMGISLYINWTSKKKMAKSNVRLFFIHLFFNFIWTPVFFGAKNLGLALVIIVVIWILIVEMIRRFWSVNKAASLILIPYLLWVSFATLLNFTLWRLN